MAIIKELDTKFGVQASYHRITAFNINYAAKQIVICVASYAAKEKRALNKAPIEEVDIAIPTNDFSLFLNSNPLEISYLWLKENVIGFEDSTDDFEVIEPNVINEALAEDG
ncbi:MAG: hypothetical protein IH571_01180 [Acholeplasmataceae bacterium]|nr:hypothetical protein [Acholeplasmataceae bacterium]